MSTVRINESISIAEYLEGELVSNVKHEYISGSVFAMVGSKNAHNMIAVNALLAFGSRLKGHACRPFNSDTKIRIRMIDHVRHEFADINDVITLDNLSLRLPLREFYDGVVSQ
jgi:Uma2 family endonuclease